MALCETIQHLIESHKEGVYWDFKQKHQKDPSDLLHDILCLSNAEHKGDRYLIFGIEDKTMKFCDLSDDENRRSQAEIIDFLKSNQSKFAKNQYPEVHLCKIKIKNNDIDVLIISDLPNKPYYLENGIKGLRPYHIYTRTCDTNTSKDKSASPDQIEKMWRERFCLDLPALEKAKALLSDCKNWKCSTQDSGNSIWSHNIFPEFTIRVEDAPNGTACDEEWTRGEIRCDKNFASYYSIYYQMTRLAKIRWVSFDDHKKNMVAPEWEPCLTGRIYYYDKDSIEYAMQKFYANYENCDYSKKLRSRTGNNIEIPVASKENIKEFLDSLPPINIHELCTDREEQYKIFIDNIERFRTWLLERTDV